METIELIKIAFRAGQNVETSGPILDDDAEFDEWFEDNQGQGKLFDLADVGGNEVALRQGQSMMLLDWMKKIACWSEETAEWEQPSDLARNILTKAGIEQ